MAWAALGHPLRDGAGLVERLDRKCRRLLATGLHGDGIDIADPAMLHRREGLAVYCPSLARRQQAIKLASNALS